MKRSVTFYGGVGTVTGANFLLSMGDLRILIDCGLEQGGMFCEEHNREDFAYDPQSIDVLLVTHAHIDHIGRIPLLVARGYRGPIISTDATKDLARLMLEDSLGVLGKEARANGLPPLYEDVDVTQALSQWQGKPYHEAFNLDERVRATFMEAGHILGSAYISVTDDERRIVFSGDIGNSPAPIIRDREEVTDADYLIMESVYGDRLHEDRDNRDARFRDIVVEAIGRGGALIIPAFSLERTQNILHELNHLVESGAVSKVPVFLDSPLAIKATSIYRKYHSLYNKHARDDKAEGDDIFSFPNLTQTLERSDSQQIKKTQNPKIIIAGSGMSHGGRVMFHEKELLNDPSSTLLISGYQAAGSLGRRLEEGVKRVKILGKLVRVRAHIEKLTGYSGHADRDDLVDFVASTSAVVKKVFVVMGETKASAFLAQRLRDYLDVDAQIPRAGVVYPLS